MLRPSRLLWMCAHHFSSGLSRVQAAVTKGTVLPLHGSLRAFTGILWVFMIAEDRLLNMIYSILDGIRKRIDAKLKACKTAALLMYTKHSGHEHEETCTLRDHIL